VATTQLLPVYAKISRKILRRSASLRVVDGIEIVTGMERLWLAVRCPMHSWTWPRSNRSERMGQYDSHQTCHKCLSRRMFDTDAWQAGPIYKKRDHLV